MPQRPSIEKLRMYRERLTTLNLELEGVLKKILKAELDLAEYQRVATRLRAERRAMGVFQ